MSRRKTGWLGAWATLGKSAAKSTARTHKRIGKALTRATGKAAVRNASTLASASQRALTGVVSPAAAPRNTIHGAWLDGHWGLGPLAQRRYRLFVPARTTTSPRLLVLLHGCGQDAASFAASTRAAAAGRAHNCLILLPEQSSQANAQRCWNWFRSPAQLATEVSIVMAIIERVRSQHAVASNAVYVFGMSAGGSMALTLGLQFPASFGAAGSHSAAAPYSAGNAVQATQAMRGKRSPDLQSLRIALGQRPMPALFVLHGNADHTVVPDNAFTCVALWLQLHADDARPNPSRRIQRGARKAADVTDWKIGAKPWLRLIRVAGLGHAWSGGAAKQAFSDPTGPDALSLFMRFVSDCQPGSGR
jgi:poly(3-hydroxybutyrate) depolymerase